MSWLEKRWYSNKPAPCWLLPLEKLYRFLANRQNIKAKQNSWSSPVPVVVVGNISIGGTGKTPLAVELISLFKEWGYRPGIVSRGYKSSAPSYPYMVNNQSSPEEAGDEPYLLYHRCNCPVVIAPDRTSAAKLLLDKTDCDLIISDDGLQHYRLGRDIEICVIDGERGLGNKHCLPAGPLREDRQRLLDVDFVVSNGASDNRLIQESIPCFGMHLEPRRFRSCVNKEQTLGIDAFTGRTVHALAGIGNPNRFFRTLEKYAGVNVIAHSMQDHQAYTEPDIHFQDDFPVLMTEKDAVKIKEIAGDEHWYLEVSAALPDNFTSQLREKLELVKEQKGNSNNG